jgi:pilus assembly protein Flp/PilA
MTKLQHKFRSLCANESGATAIEYAMIAAGVSVAIVGAVTSLGSHLKTTFYDKLAALL